jgi:serine/threonine-protein kinase
MSLERPVDMSAVGRLPRIGPYTILLELARGGMARVFLAQRDGAKDVSVVKQLLASFEAHESAAKRFYREAHVASTLEHPNIARILDADFAGQSFYIVMEYIAGSTIESITDRMISGRQPFPRAVAISVALEILHGLTYAHEAKSAEGEPLNLVHRDLSPRNIMISYAGRVKIIDFGVVHVTVDEFRTKPGVLVGTLQYFSPEQAEGGEVDHRSDLYTTSLVLYEMLTGRRWIPDVTPPEILNAILTTSPPPLRQVDQSLPEELEAIVAKGLAKKANDRWQTAREMRRALVELTAGWDDPVEGVLKSFMDRLYPDGDRRVRKAIEKARMHSALLTDKSAPPVIPSLGAVDPDERTRTAVMPSDLSSSSELSVTRPTDVGVPAQPSVTFVPGVSATELVPSLKGTMPVRGSRIDFSNSRSSQPGIAGWQSKTDREQIVDNEPPLDPTAPSKTALRPPSPPPPGPAPASTGTRRLALGAGRTFIGGRPSRSLLTPAIVIIMLSVAAIAATVTWRIVDSEESIEAQPVLTAEPRAEEKPTVAARETVAPSDEPHRESPAAPAPSGKTKHAKTSEHAPPPAAPSEEPASSAKPLLAKLKLLRAHPEDADLFNELHDAIAARAKALPQNERSRVVGTIDAAQRVLDVDGLDKGLRELIGFERAHPQ